MTGRSRRYRQQIPRISACENVGVYSKEQIRAIADHLRSTRPWTRLFGAASGWLAASDSLASAADTLLHASRTLAASCQGQDAAACQEALQRLHATALHLSDRSLRMSRYTEMSGDALVANVDKFPTESPSWAERVLGETVGGVVDRVNIFSSGPSEEDYRQALSALTNDYLVVNTTLPPDVSADFPDLSRPREVEVAEEETSTGGGSGPSTGTWQAPGYGTVATPGTVGAAPIGGGATGVPATGGASAVEPVPAIGRLEDGSTGGLRGVAPAPVAPGTAPVAPSAPIGPVGPGPAPGAPAPVAAPLAPGAPRPPATQPGLINSPNGQPRPAAGLPGRAPGAVTAGVGATRPGAMPGTIGGQATGQAAGQAAGRTAPGAARGPAAMAGQPVGQAAGRPGAAAAGGGRAGGAAPMAGAGRRGQEDESARDTWLMEDEDFWAGAEVAPSVIE